MTDDSIRPGDHVGYEPRKLSLYQRIVDFIARRRSSPPECGVCGETMRWMDNAWDCPHLFREDHEVRDSESGELIGWTTKKENL